MRIHILIAALAATVGLSGCGINTIQEQEGHLHALVLDVAGWQSKRTDTVKGVLSILKATNQIEPGTIREFESSLQSVQMVQFKAMTELSNALVRDLDARYRTLNAAEDSVMEAAAKSRTKKNQQFSDAEVRRLDDSIKADSELVNQINLAKTKYLVDVQSYNQVIGMFPTSVTAKLIGEEQRVAFSLNNRQASQENAGKLIDVAIGPKSANSEE